MDQTFYCKRREMPVAKDTSDCWGCPMKTYPTNCEQYIHWYRILQDENKGKIPGLSFDPDDQFWSSRPRVTEPDKPDITE
jgi:hypothetical protein